MYHICNKKKILINLRNFLQILFPLETSPKVNLNNTSNIHSISISNYHLSKKHLTGILQQILWYNCHNQRWIFVKVLQILYKVAESELEQLYQKLTSSLTFFCKFSVFSCFNILEWLLSCESLYQASYLCYWKKSFVTYGLIHKHLLHNLLKYPINRSFSSAQSIWIC